MEEKLNELSEFVKVQDKTTTANFGTVLKKLDNLIDLIRVNKATRTAETTVDKILEYLDDFTRRGHSLNSSSGRTM